MAHGESHRDERPTIDERAVRSEARRRSVAGPIHRRAAVRPPV